MFYYVYQSSSYHFIVKYVLLIIEFIKILLKSPLSSMSVMSEWCEYMLDLCSLRTMRQYYFFLFYLIDWFYNRTLLFHRYHAQQSLSNWQYDMVSSKHEGWRSSRLIEHSIQYWLIFICNNFNDWNRNISLDWLISGGMTKWLKRWSWYNLHSIFGFKSSIDWIMKPFEYLKCWRRQIQSLFDNDHMRSRIKKLLMNNFPNLRSTFNGDSILHWNPIPLFANLRR